MKEDALRGVLAPVPTAFAEDDLRFDPLRFAENLARWMESPLAGVLVLGSNGEAPLLAEAESDEVIAAARRVVPSGRTLLAGTGRASTALTVAATRRALDLGADAALVITPSYYRARMTPEALRRHYETVAEAVDEPIFLYHVPAYTGIDLPLPAILELARHPLVGGIKDSSGDVGRIGAISDAASPGFEVLTGSAPVLHASVKAGATGAVLAAACVAPVECCALYEAARAGEETRAAELQARITPLARAVTSGHGVAGLKALLDRTGYHGGPVRPPLLPPSAHDLAALERAWDEFRQA